MLKFALLLVTLVVVGPTLGSISLTDFHDRFSEQSQTVEPVLADYRAKNNYARGEVIRDLLGDFANLTLDMRQLTWDTWELIENHPAVNEQCLIYLRYDFDYYVWIAELDIMFAADDMDYYMQYDWRYRFTPWANFMARENSRAIYQTVQTLGRNDFLDNMDDTVFELEDELEYYVNLWEGTQEVLRNELDDLKPFAEFLREEMVWWYEYAMGWHEYLLGWVVEDIYYYCDDDFKK